MADATALLAQLTQAAKPLPSAPASAAAVPVDEPVDPTESAEPAPASDEAPGAENAEESEEEGEGESGSDEEHYWDTHAQVSARPPPGFGGTRGLADML